jgi:hypothetical protein
MLVMFSDPLRRIGLCIQLSPDFSFLCTRLSGRLPGLVTLCNSGLPDCVAIYNISPTKCAHFGCGKLLKRLGKLPMWFGLLGLQFGGSIGKLSLEQRRSAWQIKGT